MFPNNNSRLPALSTAGPATTPTTTNSTSLNSTTTHEFFYQVFSRPWTSRSSESESCFSHGEISSSLRPSEFLTVEEIQGLDQLNGRPLHVRRVLDDESEADVDDDTDFSLVGTEEVIHIRIYPHEVVGEKRFAPAVSAEHNNKRPCNDLQCFLPCTNTWISVRRVVRQRVHQLLTSLLSFSTGCQVGDLSASSVDSKTATPTSLLNQMAPTSDCQFIVIHCKCHNNTHLTPPLGVKCLAVSPSQAKDSDLKSGHHMSLDKGTLPQHPVAYRFVVDYFTKTPENPAVIAAGNVCGIQENVSQLLPVGKCKHYELASSAYVSLELTRYLTTANPDGASLNNAAATLHQVPLVPVGSTTPDLVAALTTLSKRSDLTSDLLTTALEDHNKKRNSCTVEVLGITRLNQVIFDWEIKLATLARIQAIASGHYIVCQCNVNAVLVVDMNMDSCDFAVYIVFTGEGSETTEGHTPVHSALLVEGRKEDLPRLLTALSSADAYTGCGVCVPNVKAVQTTYVHVDKTDPNKSRFAKWYGARGPTSREPNVDCYDGDFEAKSFTVGEVTLVTRKYIGDEDAHQPTTVADVASIVDAVLTLHREMNMVLVDIRGANILYADKKAYLIDPDMYMDNDKCQTEFVCLLEVPDGVRAPGLTTGRLYRPMDDFFALCGYLSKVIHGEKLPELRDYLKTVLNGGTLDAQAEEAYKLTVLQPCLDWENEMKALIDSEMKLRTWLDTDGVKLNSAKLLTSFTGP